MKRYVLIHAVSVSNKEEWEPVLLVRKNKPDWQKGFLNLLGGAVEPNELPEVAAVRELYEESGLSPYPADWRKDKVTVVEMGRIVGDDETVHCFRIFVNEEPLNPRPSETETVRWFSWQQVKDDSRLLPSLRVVMPLMLCGIRDWQLTVFETFMNKTANTVYLTVPSNANRRFTKNSVVTNILDD
jgi:8-oxo-dGTP pyrophosphatase MutT (NUDIX family)